VWAGLLGAVVMASRRHGLSVGRLFVVPRGARRWWAAIGIGVGGGLVIRIAAGVAGSPFVRWVEQEQRTRAPIDGIDVSRPSVAVLAGLAICVGAPLLEELFFRGVLLPTLARRMPVQAAMLVQALVFASLHLSLGIGWATAALTVTAIGVAGYGLAFLRVHTASLVPPIVAHSAFNLVALIVILSRAY
jgi:membrane protease YdiL (CAAX protease family)